MPGIPPAWLDTLLPQDTPGRKRSGTVRQRTQSLDRTILYHPAQT